MRAILEVNAREKNKTVSRLISKDYGFGLGGGN